MAAEFHNLNFTCAVGSIVPSGSQYTDEVYQTCAYAGNTPGSTIINGDSYLASQFGFSYSHVWRNFGILCLFTIAFIAITCWLSETMDWKLGSSGSVQYKPFSRWFQRQKSSETLNDEERSPVPVDFKAGPAEQQQSQTEGKLVATESTFTWADLELDVKIGKESRKLLNGVSGYCKPGTLTALVGASGAGKSTRKIYING